MKMKKMDLFNNAEVINSDQLNGITGGNGSLSGINGDSNHHDNGDSNHHDNGDSIRRDNGDSIRRDNGDSVHHDILN